MENKNRDNRKRMVVTGATGAIGRALIDEGIRAGYEVLAVVHRTSARAEELEHMEHCRVLRLDLSEYRNAMQEMEKQGIVWSMDRMTAEATTVDRMTADATTADTTTADMMHSDSNDAQTDSGDIFFHLAWEASYGAGRDDLILQTRNVHAAMDAVRLAKLLGCRTFVGAGSQAEYGRVDKALRPDTETDPETAYGSAKFCAGNLTRFYAEQEGLRHIWMRILSVYGPHDRMETMISTAVSRMTKNEETEFSPCEQIWDYLYSEDAAWAMILAGENGIDGKTYVLGSGEAHPLRWYIEKIAGITGYTKEIGFGKRPYNEKQVMHLVADISELTEDTGFRPTVDFETGIRNLIRHIS